MRLIGFFAKAFFAVGFVVRIVTLKEGHDGVTLKSHDVTRDAIKEPTVVADDQHAAGKVLQCVFHVNGNDKMPKKGEEKMHEKGDEK